MANVKISDLTAAGAASGTMEFEVNDSLTSKKVTGTQVADFVLGTLDSTDISGAGGLLAANNLSDIVVPATARTNLGLGTAALSAATDFVAVTGDAMTGNLTMADNVKVVMGTGSDMEIYHNGTDSVIHDNGTGGLKIRTSQLSVKNAADTATQITATEGGAVTLYHNNSSKLATSSTGVSVTGTLKVNSIEPANAGSEDYFLARAWFNLNGSGTIALRGSGNISSVTDNGTGQYTMNYSTAMADTGYSVSGAVNQVGNGSDGADLVIAGYPTATTYTTSATRVGCTWATIGFYESTGMYVTGSIHR